MEFLQKMKKDYPKLYKKNVKRALLPKDFEIFYKKMQYEENLTKKRKKKLNEIYAPEFRYPFRPNLGKSSRSVLTSYKDFSYVDKFGDRSEESEINEESEKMIKPKNLMRKEKKKMKKRKKLKKLKFKTEKFRNHLQKMVEWDRNNKNNNFKKYLMKFNESVVLKKSKKIMPLNEIKKHYKIMNKTSKKKKPK